MNNYRKKPTKKDVATAKGIVKSVMESLRYYKEKNNGEKKREGIPQGLVEEDIRRSDEVPDEEVSGPDV
jgi:hypothetical protein